ncbi:unnamed protein product, partial [Amoebophrya sp. A120]
VAKSYNLKKDTGTVLMRVVEEDTDASCFHDAAPATSHKAGTSERNKRSAVLSSRDSSFSVISEDVISLSDLRTEKSSFVLVSDARS